MRALLITALGLSAALPPAPVLLPEAWQGWRYVRTLELGERSGARTPGLLRLRVPLEVRERSLPELEDLRVLDAVGREVPFVIQARTGKQAFEWRDAKLQEVSFKPEQYTQVVIDTGVRRRLHNALRLSAESNDFMVWVELSIAERPGQWRILRPRAPIYRFRDEQVEGSQIISYPESHSRYLRARIFDSRGPFPVVGCEVGVEVREEPVRLPVDPALALVDSRPSPLESDFGERRIPISEVRFETDQPEFHRVVRVRAREEGREWRQVGQGEIYRSSARGSRSESLSVGFPETAARHWQVEVLDRSDAPLSGLRARLLSTAQDVVFKGDGPGPWRLIYGNSRAQAAVYDLRNRVDPQALERAAGVLPGAEEENSAFLDPRPFTERQPFVLWLVIGVTAATLAGFALRVLRASTRASPTNPETQEASGNGRSSPERR